MAHLTPHHDWHKAKRLGLALVIGIAAALVPLPGGVSGVAHVLVGFSVTALGFAVPLIRLMMRATPEQTEAYADGLDPGRSVTDIVLGTSALASLAGVGLMLLTKGTSQTASVVEAGVAVATVFSAWVLVHTVFGLRYARHWHNAEEGCIDFHMPGPPAYSDFLYMAFAVGVSFAISDTDLRTTAVRRIALRQSWLSYLFGTVVVAATINLIAGMAG